MQNIIIIGEKNSGMHTLASKIKHHYNDYEIYEKDSIYSIKKPFVLIMNSLSEIPSDTINNIGSSLILYTKSIKDHKELIERLRKTFEQKNIKLECNCDSIDLLNFGCKCGYINKNKRN